MHSLELALYLRTIPNDQPYGYLSKSLRERNDKLPLMREDYEVGRNYRGPISPGTLRACAFYGRPSLPNDKKQVLAALGLDMPDLPLAWVCAKPAKQKDGHLSDRLIEMTQQRENPADETGAGAAHARR